MSVLAVSNLEWPVEKLASATIAFDSSYPTGGETLQAKDFGLSRFTRIQVRPTGATAGGAGYQFVTTLSSDGTTALVLPFVGPGGTAVGTNATSAVTGTGTFTGTAPVGDLNIATPAFSGTGTTAAGQVITTTDNQTMTLNQCAGMWLIQTGTATTVPVIILSNTAVTGAPAVLTVQGVAATVAGTYIIVKALTPVGTVSALSGTAAGQVFTGSAGTAGVLVQLANATSLAALTAVPVNVWGY